jgi:hypothetical protein
LCPYDNRYIYLEWEGQAGVDANWTLPDASAAQLLSNMLRRNTSSNVNHGQIEQEAATLIIQSRGAPCEEDDEFLEDETEVIYRSMVPTDETAHTPTQPMQLPHYSSHAVHGFC